MLNKFDVFKDDANNCFQLRTKTDSYTLEFDDPEKEAIFLKVVDIVIKDPAITLKKLKSKLAQKYPEPQIMEVLSVLNGYELLSESMAASLLSGQDVATHAGTKNDQTDAIVDRNIAIIGDGGLATALLKTAKSQPFKNSLRYSFSELADKDKIEKIVSQADFLIVDANEWSPYHIEIINECALRHTKPWLYVSGIEGVAAKIGPLFYGQETGCYNCLISRIKSNNDYPSFLVSYEHHLKENKKASKPDILPNADLVYYTIANLALLEVMKFFYQWSLPVTWKTLLSLDVTSFTMSKHALLKKPFCEVCKPSLAYNPAPWLEAVTLK